MSLFSTPKVDVPQEDPAVTAARLRQQNQADATLTQSIQDDLRTQMQSRLQRFGLVPGAPNAGGGNGPSVTTGFMAPHL